MKLYTTEQQTAKLIELRFEKPKDIEWYDANIHKVVVCHNYSIGELLTFLPTRTYSGSIYIDHNGLWRVGYENTVLHQSEFELIDALYSMCVKLKEEGVI